MPWPGISVVSWGVSKGKGLWALQDFPPLAGHIPACGGGEPPLIDFPLPAV